MVRHGVVHHICLGPLLTLVAGLKYPHPKRPCPGLAISVGYGRYKRYLGNIGQIRL